MTPQSRARILDPSTNNPFAHPSGWLGRLAGWIMLWTNKHGDVLRVLDVQPGDDVLEIGYGPGGLIRQLAERTDAAGIRGVDPSPEMRDQAKRHNRRAVRVGRVELGLGTADRTGLPDASVDRVVSVRSVAIWPDQAASGSFAPRIAPSASILPLPLVASAAATWRAVSGVAVSVAALVPVKSGWPALPSASIPP